MTRRGSTWLAGTNEKGVIQSRNVDKQRPQPLMDARHARKDSPPLGLELISIENTPRFLQYDVRARDVPDTKAFLKEPAHAPAGCLPRKQQQRQL